MHLTGDGFVFSLYLQGFIEEITPIWTLISRGPRDWLYRNQNSVKIRGVMNFRPFASTNQYILGRGKMPCDGILPPHAHNALDTPALM